MGKYTGKKLNKSYKEAGHMPRKCVRCKRPHNNKNKYCNSCAIDMSLRRPLVFTDYYDEEDKNAKTKERIQVEKNR